MAAGIFMSSYWNGDSARSRFTELQASAPAGEEPDQVPSSLVNDYSVSTKRGRLGLAAPENEDLKQAAVDAVNAYWNSVNGRHYREAWNLLSKELKSGFAKNDFARYVKEIKDKNLCDINLEEGFSVQVVADIAMIRGRLTFSVFEDEICKTVSSNIFFHQLVLGEREEGWLLNKIVRETGEDSYEE